MLEKYPRRTGFRLGNVVSGRQNSRYYNTYVTPSKFPGLRNSKTLFYLDGMISHVRGKLISKKTTEVVIETFGVGYRIFVPASTFSKLPDPGNETLLFTHHYVREDTSALYGFETEASRTVFEIMIGVSGIGPKLALAVLSAMNPAELQGAIVSEDDSMLTRIPGVGKKTAQRMVIELRDKLITFDAGGRKTSDSGEDRTEMTVDAIGALITLGMSRIAAEKKIRSVLKSNPDISSAEDLTRLALRSS